MSAETVIQAAGLDGVLGARIDAAAVHARRSLGVRLPTAALAAALLGLNLGWTLGSAWFGAILLAEAWTFAATRRQMAGETTHLAARLNYLAACLALACVWSAAGLLCWFAGDTATRIAALCFFAGQMVHAQAFTGRSLATLVATGAPPTAALVALPLFYSGFSGARLTLVAMATVLVVTYAWMAARLNRRAADALEAARAEAEQASQAKSAFLAMMSHELRTPMNGVLGMARALKDGKLDARQADQVEMLIRSGDTLMAILNDILDLSKVEAGKLELEMQVFDLPDLVQRVRDLWREAAAAKSLNLVCHIDPAIPQWVEGDPTRIRQVMMNLVSNALKFTAEGCVRLTVRPARGAGVEISVDDTGIGISPEQQTRLFQPFTQADLTVARRFGGTGLGLAICRELAEMMGGYIVVESAAGEGSTFRVTLPLAAAEPPAQVEDAGAEAGGIAGLRILVVEDNLINQAVARAVLEAAEAVVDMAGDGAEGLERLRGQAYDLVLMDVHMPRMDGIEAVRRIRSGEAGVTIDTPVIALTADAMAGEDKRLIRLGFDAVQAKPINPAELIAAIAAGAGAGGAERSAAA